MKAKIFAPIAILAVFIAVVLLIPDSDETPLGNADISSLKTGDMSKLVVHETPFNVMETAFTGPTGAEMTVADLNGKIVVMNFWATWCAPCREEMPSIDRLAAEMSGEDVAVLAVSTDRGAESKITRFFEEVGVQNLGIYRDKESELAREAGAFGLPLTIILNRDGREVARLLGGAEWDSDEAKAIIRKLASANGAAS
ncbi:TlpA family protein disulfide reductase [Rhodobacteraceae bacterium NNCM2]|nr:TlpA family protein disulfide reductase [Coraliihabitans acroporae]